MCVQVVFSRDKEMDWKITKVFHFFKGSFWAAFNWRFFSHQIIPNCRRRFSLEMSAAVISCFGTLQSSWKAHPHKDGPTYGLLQLYHKTPEVYRSRSCWGLAYKVVFPLFLANKFLLNDYLKRNDGQRGGDSAYAVPEWCWLLTGHNVPLSSSLNTKHRAPESNVSVWKHFMICCNSPGMSSQ